MKPFRPAPAAEKRTLFPKGVPRLCDVLEFNKDTMELKADDATTRAALDIYTRDSYGSF